MLKHKTQNTAKRQVLAELYDLKLGQNASSLRQILHYIPFLEGLSADRLDELAAKCELLEFSADQEVIRQGDIGNCMYFVILGRLRVYKTDENEKQLLGELGRNQLFGESAVFEHGPRNATVIAVEPCLLLSLSQETIQSFLKKPTPNCAKKCCAWPSNAKSGQYANATAHQKKSC